jgi:NAD+--asparagine ADP-ribosyltransferase
MTYGSRANYAEPRNEAALLSRARVSGLLPKPGPSHQAMLTKQLGKIRKGMEINAVRDRRVQQDQRINHQLETERMSDLLRRSRGSGLRTSVSERMNANNVGAQVGAY